jgi:predicted nucleic acid-binding Zn ribbon protein
MEPDEIEFRQACELISQRRIHLRRPKTPARLVARILARSGAGQQQANSELHQAWQAAAGPDHQQQSRPGALRRGKLDIVVPDSMTLQQMTFRQADLLSTLQARLPHARISGLRFRVDPAWFRAKE